MTARRLARADWRSYFDYVSKGLSGEQAELEVVSLAIGDQLEAKWVPLFGISYDPKADIFEIALEGIDHLISHPQQVNVEETERGLVSLEITTDDETQQILKLRKPLALPPK